jgi:hypothetical protein
MLTIATADVVGVTLHTNRLTYQGAAVADIPLYDDGTHGDDTAGDRVFTTDSLSLPSMTRAFSVAVLRTTPLTLRHADQSEETISVDLALILHYVAASVPTPSVVPLGRRRLTPGITSLLMPPSRLCPRRARREPQVPRAAARRP